MTISSTTNSVSYDGDGATTEFDYTFQALADADLKVILRLKATGAETELTLDTDYSVARDADNEGGTVTYPIAGDALASTYEIHIIRAPAQTQTSDYTEGGRFSADTLEDNLDRLTASIQWLQHQLDRAVKYVSTTDTADVDTADDFLDAMEAAQAAAELAETNAETAETNAAASAAAALVSENNAAASEAAAAASAEEAAGAVAGVASWNGRTGAVVPVAGDFDSSEISFNGAVSGLSASNAKAALDELAAEKMGSLVSDASPTLGGTLGGAGNLVQDIILADYMEKSFAHGDVSSNVSFSYSAGIEHTLNLSGAATFTFTDWPTSNAAAMLLLISNAGKHSITWTGCNISNVSLPSTSNVAALYGVYRFQAAGSNAVLTLHSNLV